MKTLHIDLDMHIKVHVIKIMQENDKDQIPKSRNTGNEETEWNRRRMSKELQLCQS